MLCPGLRLAWRSPDTVQFGIDVPHPLIISGLPPIGRQLLATLNGIRTEQEIVAQLVADGADGAAVAGTAAVLRRLADLGVVVDGGQWPGRLPLTSDLRERLEPDIRATSALERWRREPAARWEALSRCHITVAGVSRLGATLAHSLAAAGVARVELDDPRPVTPADVSLGGFAPTDVGERRADLVLAHQESGSRSRSSSIVRHLVVVTDAVETHPRCRALAAAGTPHLVVSCHELLGRVGPLVQPGQSPCQFCLELARRDVDRDWPAIWRQQVTDSTPSADGVLIAITAQIAAAHVLDWLTGGQPPSVGGFVEVAAPHASTTLRHLVQHPECGCAWPESGPSLTMAR
ncbi:MAG: TOMM precursor leader peptide-binding protein [Actinomycetia bacterium]|nr:TOMM precursor leader peptide-binding protein [Actinomycetes bacterium]